MAEYDSALLKLSSDYLEVSVKLSFEFIYHIVCVIELIVNPSLRFWDFNFLPWRAPSGGLPDYKLFKFSDDLRYSTW